MTETPAQPPARDWRRHFRLREQIAPKEFNANGSWIEKYEGLKLRPKGFKQVSDPEFGFPIYVFDEATDREDEKVYGEFERFRKEQPLKDRVLESILHLFSK